MGKIIVIAGLLAIGLAGSAAAQKGNSGDRALGTELNRDRAETRIERLRQDQRQKEQKEERGARAKAQGSSTTQQTAAATVAALSVVRISCGTG